MSARGDVIDWLRERWDAGDREYKMPREIHAQMGLEGSAKPTAASLWHLARYDDAVDHEEGRGYRYKPEPGETEEPEEAPEPPNVQPVIVLNHLRWAHVMDGSIVFRHDDGSATHIYGEFDLDGLLDQE